MGSITTEKDTDHDTRYRIRLVGRLLAPALHLLGTWMRGRKALLMACQYTRLIPTMEQNLLRLWRQRTEADDISGRDWYPSARRIVGEWSEHYGYSVDTVACVIAAISPQCNWERNLIIADDVLAQRPPSIGGIRLNIDKAIGLRIENDGFYPYADESISARMLRRFPGGPKVNNFAHNLAGYDHYVTIDNHAAQAAMNTPAVSYGLPRLPYGEFAKAYVSVASMLNVPPATFQAIVWCAWKRLYPAADKRQLIRESKS